MSTLVFFCLSIVIKSEPVNWVIVLQNLILILLRGLPCSYRMCLKLLDVRSVLWAFSDLMSLSKCKILRMNPRIIKSQNCQSICIDGFWFNIWTHRDVTHAFHHAHISTKVINSVIKILSCESIFASFLLLLLSMFCFPCVFDSECERNNNNNSFAYHIVINLTPYIVPLNSKLKHK